MKEIKYDCNKQQGERGAEDEKARFILFLRSKDRQPYKTIPLSFLGVVILILDAG